MISVDTKKTIESILSSTKAKERAVNKALIVSAAELADRIKGKINRKQSRGRAYKRGANGRVHYASTAGNPPNGDIGFLAWSTQPSKRVVNSSTEVIVGADYARALEYGRRGMAARPFIRPARNETERRVRLRLFRAINAS